MHDRKGADQRYRNRQGGDQRGAKTAEEQEHHHHHQHHGNQQGHFGFVQRRLDHRRAVHRDIEADTGRQHRSQRWQLRLDLRHGFNDVGARLAVDDQQHGTVIVVEAAVVTVFHGVADFRHVLEAQGRSVLVANDQRRIILGGFQLIVGLHLPVMLVVLHKPLRSPYVGAGDRSPHVVERYAVLGEHLRLQLDTHSRQRAAADLHFADPGNL